MAPPRTTEAGRRAAGCRCRRRGLLGLSNESRTKSWIAVSIPETSCGSWPCRLRRGHVLEQQSGLAVDQEYVLHAKLDRVLEHDVGKAAPAAQRLEAPLQPSPREAVLDRLVEPLQRAVEGLGDGLADRRSHQRVEDADQRARVLADRRLRRTLQCRRKRLGEMFVPGRGKREGVRQHGADRFGELLRIVDLLLQPGKRGLLLLEKNAAHRLQPRIPLEPARQRRRHVLIDAARHLQQEVGEPLVPGAVRAARVREFSVRRSRESEPWHYHVSVSVDRLLRRTCVERIRRHGSGAFSGLAALRSHVLVQASRDLDEQAGQQIAVGLHVAELGEHSLDGCAGVLVPPPHFVAQRLRSRGPVVP